jgi:hypothetical protein
VIFSWIRRAEPIPNVPLQVVTCEAVSVLRVRICE